MTPEVDDAENLDEMMNSVEAARKKEFEFVIRDQAIEVWGKLRGIDQLNSATAERLLVESMKSLITKIPKATNSAAIRANARTIEAAKKLRKALVACWGETGSGTGPSASLKKCRICGGLKSQHKKDCIVQQALVAARSNGIT